jgi:hypothetical protein
MIKLALEGPASLTSGSSVVMLTVGNAETFADKTNRRQVVMVFLNMSNIRQSLLKMMVPWFRDPGKVPA